MRFIYSILILLGSSTILRTQTSWKGTINSDWNIAGNWTAGIPGSSTDVIIGDANFTGNFQPALTASSYCKSLLIGSGTKASTLTVSKNITVSGALTIGTNGALAHTSPNTVITLSGNWTNTGVYTTGTTAKVTFAGAAQSINGATTFNQLTINAGSTTSLSHDIAVNNLLYVSGTLDPTSGYKISGTGSVTVNSSGILLVKALDFQDNYNLSGSYTLSGTSTINYASSLINQNVTNTLTYGYLKASGGTTKTLTGNLPSLNASSNASGRIYVDAGTTLDLLDYTSNRGNHPGGSIILAANSRLKINGTNSIPLNYSTKSFATTSTVEYCGTNQTVLETAYGNLIFSSNAGNVVKTMPTTNMTIAGGFTVTPGNGTGVTFTAGDKITVNQNTFLDANTVFNAGSYSHTFKGNWLNNGTLNGNTSTISFTGVNSVLSGTGINNFYHLKFSKTGITAAGTTSINVSGSLYTTASGNFAHNSGGLLTMTGASKIISGNGLSLSNFSVTGSISTNSDLTITGSLTVNGSLAASGGILTMSGLSKSVSGNGPLSFNSLSVLGTITAARDYSVSANLVVSLAGSLTQTAGTTFFTGTANTLSGACNLYNVTINSGKTLKLGSNSNLGIGNIFTKTGTLNVTTTIPNTVTYNSASAQSIVNASYHNLTLENGGLKTAAGAITVNNDFINKSTSTFNAASYLFSLYRHFTNNGVFTASTSTIQLLGANAANISGATTFNNLTQNKSSSAIKITLNSSIVTNTLAMITGNMNTGTNTVTINGSRSGAGIIIGIIAHNHAFVNGTTYYFEGPQNGITFNAPSAGLTLVTVTVSTGSIPDFLGGDCVTRLYNISIPAGTYTDAKLQLHYEDNELNAFVEPQLSQYHHNAGTNTWDSIGVTTRNTTTNYVEKTALTNITGRWALSGMRDVVRWNGSVSSAWENAANWTTISGTSMVNRVPTSTDAAEIGQAAFLNNPVISSTRTISVLKYGSAQESILTLNSGASLTTMGAVKGSWSGAATHTLNVGSGSLTVGTNMSLSDGIAGHDIELRIGSGSVAVANDLDQGATSSVNFTGSGSLFVSGNYHYTGGNFTPNTGTVIYTGGNAQVVAPLTYYNLFFTKNTEEATVNSPITVNGNLTTGNGGSLLLNDTITVLGNITIGANTNLIENSTRINIGGNWNNSGIFTVESGTVNFNGTANQSVNTNTFNTVLVNKPSGTLSLTGDVYFNHDLTVTTGTVNISTYLANRSDPGGTLTLDAASCLKVAGASNFPANFIINNLSTTSTVEYLGTGAQDVLNIDYGNLTLSNGGSSAKLLSGDIRVAGNLLINTGATLNGDSTKITVFGNITNNGTFNPGASTMLLSGVAGSIAGNWTFYDLTMVGTYYCTSTTIIITNDLHVDATGSLNLNTASTTLDGDLVNNGTLISNGISTFTGTRVQTIQLLNAISSSGGTINFNGTVSPVLNSTSSPQFAILNINNTGGITPSTPWLVAGDCNIGAGASFNGGALAHTFLGNFTNNGTVTSSGEMRFSPTLPYSSGATVNLGAGSYTSTGKTRFGGTVPLTVTGTNAGFYNVDITNTNALGITPLNDWVIQNDLLVASNSTLNLSSFSYTVGGDLINNGTVNGNSSNITFTGNNKTINGVGSSTFNDIIIDATADLALNQNISITRDFSNNGTFTTNGFELVFNGSTNSTISSSSGQLVLDELNQNKTGGAVTTLSVPVVIHNKLNLQNGVINSSSANMLTIADDAISTGGNSGSFVNGPMKKIGDDAFEFPVGNNTVWARIGISAPASANAEFQAQYYATAFSNTSSVLAPLDHVSKIEHWTLNRTAGTDSVEVTLFWENGSRSVINSLIDLVVAGFDGTNWIDKTQDGGITGSTALGTVKSKQVSSFGAFTFGSRSGLNPLPIELIDFKATCNSGGALINWKTASERNCNHYIIDKSANGIDWQSIGKINGSGNSYGDKNYAYQDNENHSEIVYYRLSQVDNDGTTETFNIVSIDCMEEKNTNQMILYPNPAHNELHVDLKLIENYGNGVVKIIDNMGRIVLEENVQLGQGLNTNRLDINVTAGLYSVYVYSDQMSLPVQQLIVR